MFMRLANRLLIDGQGRAFFVPIHQELNVGIALVADDGLLLTSILRHHIQNLAVGHQELKSAGEEFFQARADIVGRRFAAEEAHEKGKH